MITCRTNLALLLLLVTVSTVFLAPRNLSAQQANATETLFNSDMQLGFVWGGGLQFNSIQDETGSLIQLYAGALFSKQILLALMVGANVGHPRVNYAHVGFMGQYTAQPSALLHWSAQVAIGTGGTKDYEQEKSSLMDNFGNTTGAGYYFLEPGANGEVNLSPSVRLLVGVSYRLVFGLDEDTKFTERTHVTAEQMSGFNINIGVKIGSYE